MQGAPEFVFRIEPESLTRSNHGSICGPVWCQFGEIEFPQSHWSDLVAAVLSWSLEATVTLANGRKRNAGIRFLDGPFEVRVFSKRRHEWQAELVEERLTGTYIHHQFDFAPEPFIQSLLACSDEVLQACSKNGWTSGDIDSIILQRERLFHYAAKNRDLR